MPRILTLGFPMAPRAGDLLPLGFGRPSSSRPVLPGCSAFFGLGSYISREPHVSRFNPPLQAPLRKPDKGLPPGVERNGPLLFLPGDEKPRMTPHHLWADPLYVDNAAFHLRKGEARIQKPLGSSQSHEILRDVVFPCPYVDAGRQKPNLMPISDSPCFKSE